MSSSYGTDAGATPPLERKKAEEGWLSKVIEVEEAKDQILFALPMIPTNVSYYFIPLVSVMFAGHVELAGSNLANSWAAVTGYALMFSLVSSLIHIQLECKQCLAIIAQA